MLKITTLAAARWGRIHPDPAIRAAARAYFRRKKEIVMQIQTTTESLTLTPHQIEALRLAEFPVTDERCRLFLEASPAKGHDSDRTYEALEWARLVDRDQMITQTGKEALTEALAWG